MNLNTPVVKRPADWSRVSWSENARDLFCAAFRYENLAQLGQLPKAS